MRLSNFIVRYKNLKGVSASDSQPIAGLNIQYGTTTFHLEVVHEETSRNWNYRDVYFNNQPLPYSLDITAAKFTVIVRSHREAQDVTVHYRNEDLEFQIENCQVLALTSAEMVIDFEISNIQDTQPPKTALQLHRDAFPHQYSELERRVRHYLGFE